MKFKDNGYNRLLFGDRYSRELSTENINEVISESKNSHKI